MSKRYLPYSRHCIDQSDIDAVIEVLRSDWLTTGPKVEEFERAVCDYTGAAECVAVANGTAALHAAYHALGIGPGDEVIVPAITFAATANAVLYNGGRPVFADVNPHNLLVDPDDVARKITPRTKAIVGVDYAGHPCDYDALAAIATKHGVSFLADACHALGAEYRDKRVGALADVSTFSFHPVKPIATGEGGMITTMNPASADKMRIFRNHGITTSHRQREERGTWEYEMAQLGFNYRLNDIQCALGISQLKRLDRGIARREEIAAAYDQAFASSELIRPLQRSAESRSSHHLYVIRIDFSRLKKTRAEIFTGLRHAGIGVNVHYIPVYLHPYYRALGYQSGLCPAAELAYEEILSIPNFAQMSDEEVTRVASVLMRITE